MPSMWTICKLAVVFLVLLTTVEGATVSTFSASVAVTGEGVSTDTARATVTTVNESLTTNTSIVTATPSPGAADNITMVVRLAREYREEYGNYSHPATRELLANLQSMFRVVYRNNTNYMSTDIWSLRNGSLLVGYIVMFSKRMEPLERSKAAGRIMDVARLGGGVIPVVGDNFTVLEAGVMSGDSLVNVTTGCSLAAHTRMCNSGTCQWASDNVSCICPTLHTGALCQTNNTWRVAVGVVSGVLLVVVIVAVIGVVCKKKNTYV